MVFHDAMRLAQKRDALELWHIGETNHFQKLSACSIRVNNYRKWERKPRAQLFDYIMNV